MKCPTACSCLCHEFGITAEHGTYPVCPTKIKLPLVDPQWVISRPPAKAEAD